MKPNNQDRNLRRLDGESGQTTAWTVAILVLLFAIMAFAVDLGFMFHARRLMQNAADPATLAGAQALGQCALAIQDHPLVDDPEALGEYYAERNLAAKIATRSDSAPHLEQRTWSFQGVEFPSMYAQVNRQENFLFAGFLGLSFANIPGEAEAACVYANEYEGICPFYVVAPNPSDNAPGEGTFGIEYGKVYKFDFGAKPPQGYAGGHRGHLDLYQSNNLHTIVANGCVGTFKDNGGNCAIQEDSVVEGQFDACLLPGNRASAARQGVSDYYTYEGTGGFPSHATCNIYYDEKEFTVDPLGPAEPLDANGRPLSTQAIEAKIDACDEDPDPTDRVSGRLWPIAILSQLPKNGNQPQTITHVALMYQVCDHYDNKFDCSIGGNGGNDAIYGMFVESRPVNFKVSGVGTMPGGAVHVVLVK